MHPLEKGVTIQGIQRNFHDYGDVLGYKAQVLEFVHAKQGLWLLKTKQNLLFLVLEVQIHIASRVFKIIH